MSELEQALQWNEGHKGDLVAGLTRLVATPSVVGSEGACQRLVAERMEGICDSVDVWEPDAAWLERHPAYFLSNHEFRETRGPPDRRVSEGRRSANGEAKGERRSNDG